MISYYLIFVISLIYYFIQSRHKNPSSILFFSFMLIIALFIGLGDMIGGYDRYIYGEVFDSIADEMRGGRNFSRLFYLVNGKEFGYFAWQIIVSVFTPNRYIFILVTTLTIYYLFFRVMKKYILNYPLAVILFMGMMFYFSMTYLREVFGIAILWQGLKYIWERKFWKYVFFVLLAASFHGSILIALLMYFVPIKLFSKTSIIFSLIMVLLIGMTPLPNLILANAGNLTEKSIGGVNAYELQDQGFRIEYVLEVLFFMWMIFKNYNKIDMDKRTLTFLNMTIGLCFILLFFMRFGQGGRFAWPFYIGVFYMIPYLVSKNKTSLPLTPIVLVVFSLLFIRISIAWKPLNAPYTTFLTNGMPAGNGEMFNKYEYDLNYVDDKFYRPAFDIALIK
ncbi:EpsG family protein [Prevotella histicola]|uniref:EpsG family protein n=1 Tax=Prevotella histicola TaxID=470565 RepID=UPI001C5D64DD|nr:EpsG family protein [Prevotella histicola]MBS6662192.1 EpsG family protein [Prevotella histicola]MBW4774646.1 EpsG family protein [Prevotella histicola]